MSACCLLYLPVTYTDYQVNSEAKRMNSHKRTLRSVLTTFKRDKSALTPKDHIIVARWSGQHQIKRATDEELVFHQLMWLDDAIGDSNRFHLDPDAWRVCIERFASQFNLDVQHARNLVQSFVYDNASSQPVFLAIEGLDGSGKTVQTTMLKEYLESTNNRVLTLDFPQYESFFGNEIGKLLSGTNEESNAMNLDPKAMCLWYALDRWSTLSKIDWRNYDYVLFNRYTLSSAVYQTAREYDGLNWDFANWVFELEHVQLKLPIPDLYIVLETPVKDAKENVFKKKARTYVEGLDVYERSSELLSRCRKIYLELAKSEPDIQIVPCCTSEGTLKATETIRDNIIGIIQDYVLL